jgi:membrane carboxypeptidase/penicillin-binding protein PbpC
MHSHLVMALVSGMLLLLFEVDKSAQQIQSFVSKPNDTSVSIGETAVLKCSVSARHGDVQWTHEGTALGYDRKVPGKPRYTVIWQENEDTEYHLKIVNVTMDDEGAFACQVAPIGDWDTKLEAKAKLSVLVGPKSRPEMMFNDESKNADEIIHFRAANNKQNKLTCTVRKSKPAASIKWFINGSLVNANHGKTTESKQTGRL